MLKTLITVLLLSGSFGAYAHLDTPEEQNLDYWTLRLGEWGRYFEKTKTCEGSSCSITSLDYYDKNHSTVGLIYKNVELGVTEDFGGNSKPYGGYHWVFPYDYVELDNYVGISGAYGTGDRDWYQDIVLVYKPSITFWAFDTLGIEAGGLITHERDVGVYTSFKLRTDFNI